MKRSAIEFIAGGVLPLAMQLIPSIPRSVESDAFLLAIGYQESKFTDRVQVGGPARSFFQFEENGGVLGVYMHDATKEYLRIACEIMAVPCKVHDVYVAMAHNDVLACLMARLLIRTLPDYLPGPRAPRYGWSQYLEAWRPGVPRDGDWAESWEIGWSTAKAFYG